MCIQLLAYTCACMCSQGTCICIIHTATRWTNSPFPECSHQYQEWQGDVPHTKYDLPLQQGAMEYYQAVMGTEFSQNGGIHVNIW